MASSSVIGTYRAALAAALAARAGLSGVAVHAFPVGPDDAGAEGLWLAGVDADQEPFTMGGRRLERFTLEVVVWALAAGDGDTVAAAAEDRALALWAEVEGALGDDASVSGAALDSEVAGYSVEPGASEGERWSRVTGRVVVQAILD